MRNGVQFHQRLCTADNLSGMVFKRLLQALGVGGPSVETVLINPNCRPGGVLEGHVQVIGGGEDPMDIEYLAIGLVTRVEIASGDTEYSADQEFHRQRLTGSFRLDPGARHEIAFQFDVPWETPITEVYGQHLHGMTMGLATELEVARAVDKSDLDLVAVHPLPAQERILNALLRLGFRFSRADVERGRIPGAHQQLPFYQEIEFFPPSGYASGMTDLELTFLPTPDNLQVLLEIDRRDRAIDRGLDIFGSFDVDYATIDQIDWAAQVESWLRQSASRRGMFF
jgi:sporulation-control protein